jgi:DNA-directed RNA polymerase subunit K/omega
MADEEDYDDDDEVEVDGDDDTDEDVEEDEEEVLEEAEPHETFDNITVVVVKPENRMTSDLMSLTEFCAVLGIRAQQIENGDDFYVDVTTENTAIDIAKKELYAGKTPCIVERVLHKKADTIIVEHWKVSELTLPITVRPGR